LRMLAPWRFMSEPQLPIRRHPDPHPTAVAGVTQAALDMSGAAMYKAYAQDAAAEGRAVHAASTPPPLASPTLEASEEDPPILAAPALLAEGSTLQESHTEEEVEAEQAMVEAEKREVEEEEDLLASMEEGQSAPCRIYTHSRHWKSQSWVDRSWGMH
jgi:hypothetical protein